VVTNPVNVLVVDDSALMRNLVSKIVQSCPDLAVVGTAMNGKFALSKIESLKPDILVLDIEMPEMNGIEFLKERKDRGIEIPVIVLSSIARKGAAVTMEALSLGASDFIMKPSGSVSEDIHVIGAQLIDLLKYFGKQYQTRHPSVSRTISPEPVVIEPHAPLPSFRYPKFEPVDPKLVPRYTPENKPGPLEIIAIGISTGGPNALRKVFNELDPNLKVPIVVVQHMPAGFTSEFAKSLDRNCPLEVKEAADGDLIKPGRILIAPGDYHIRVEKKALAAILHLDSSSAVNGHRPSADVLFESVVEAYGNRAMAIIMTGMGKDGAQKIGLVYKAGGVTIGQDENSSVVYGMPRVAFENGYLTKQVSLDNMAKTINELVKQMAT
jgi:two-component system chemotaxis response regulator CheB